MKKIFIAFAGSEIEQIDKIRIIKKNYECWNLKKFKYEDFISTIQKAIQPTNKNVKRHYEMSDQSPFYFNQNYFSKSSWGLILPDIISDCAIDSCADATSLINLYSSSFLHPIFYVSSIGIITLPHILKKICQKYEALAINHEQNQAKFFNKDFYKYFKTLAPQGCYTTWYHDRSIKWTEEEWQLCMANMMFERLQKFDFGRDCFLWQAESRDIATILESLLSDKKDHGEIGYKLRKRSAVLISYAIPNIEKDVKDLYNQRSDFVHGSFFTEIYKNTKKTFSSLPTPDLSFLNKQRKNVRYIIVSYLYLGLLIKKRKLPHAKILDNIEEAVTDVKLRSFMQKETKKIINLLK